MKSKGPLGLALIALAITASFVFVPVLGALVVCLLPVPLAIIYIRHGANPFTLVSVAVLALASVLGFPALTGMFLWLCICGLVLGRAVVKAQPDDKAVFLSSAVPFLAVVPLAAAYFAAAGINPVLLLDKIISQDIAQSQAIYVQMGMSRADIDAMMPTLKAMAQVIRDYLPAIVAACAAATGFTCWIVLKRYARKAGIRLADWDYHKWRLPEHLVWGVIVPGFLMIPGVPALRVVSGNLLIIFALPYLFLGVALLAHMFDKFKLSPFLRVLIFIIVALQPLLAAVLWAAGFLDTWFDFRKLQPKKP